MPSQDLIMNTAVEVAFGDITGSFVAALTNTRPLVFFEVVNDTDADVWVSTDGTNEHIFIRAGESWGVPAKAMDVHESSSLSLKHDGAAPTSGKVVFMSGYVAL